MAFRRAARVKQTSTDSGASSIGLIAAATGFKNFSDAFGAGPVKVLYAISGSSYFEVGIGTYNSAGPTLARDVAVLASSNGGSLVTLPAATHDVYAWDPGLAPSQVITGNTTLGLADLFGSIVFTGGSGTTLGLPAIANVPPGIGFWVFNRGTADLTIDPNSSENINDATTLVLKPNEAAFVNIKDPATAQWVALVGAVNLMSRNAQTGTGYAIVTADKGKHVTFNNASPVAVTIAQAGAAFPNGWFTYVENLGAGVVTITPSTSTYKGGTALKLRQGEWAIIDSDGAQYGGFTTGQVTGAPSVREVGTRGVPQLIQNAAYQFTLDDAGGHVYHTDATPRTYTIPANASVAFPIGSAITVINGAGAADVTIAITSDTLQRGDGTAGTGSRTVKASSVVTLIKIAATTWIIAGTFS